MIKTLYKIFQEWSKNGSIYIISDTHFEDFDCKLMDPNWIEPDEQVEIINKLVHTCDTLIHLGDVGNAKYIGKLKAGRKILILGNHDKRKDYIDVFDEIYEGPLFIADRILLSHEPVSLPWCLNIHGHDHNGVKEYLEGCKHINLAANVCGYVPINLGKIIKIGVLSDIHGIHRYTIGETPRPNDKSHRRGL